MTDVRDRSTAVARKKVDNNKVDKLPPGGTPIIPKNSISGQSLISVIAIMTFLASLTTGAVMLVLGSAAEWQSEVSREMTIQVRPVSGRDIEADVKRATEIARAAPAVADVRPYSKEESTSLLEPWLGTGLSLEDLPIPRLIVVRLTPGKTPDAAALRAALASQVASASLDDHRGWIDRMHTMASTAVAAGFGVLALMLAATALSVGFATRGAMAANRPIVGVLHFIGAKNAFIAGQFRRHFLLLGLKGGLIGGGAAILFFALAGRVADWLLATATGSEITALFGTFSIGTAGYVAVVGQVLLIALVTAETSRQVVNHTLNSVD
jgi:cell division transport system permease protein